METKTLKIEIPKGYEIDKEKSTFDNIVLKKIENVVIKWNKNYNGVEINTDGEHFILDGNPSYCMSWDDATRFYNNNKHRNQTWNLPTVEQLRVMYKYFDEINKVIEENDGFILFKSIYWSVENKDKSYAWFVNMTNGYFCLDYMISDYYVRAVSTL